MRSTILSLVLLINGIRFLTAAPVYLQDQFEMPPGFRIYKAATAELSGGSYAITFDGQGRLLVGDGRAVRRLLDDDGDGVYDRHEVIAEGLGGRGPQGLLVYGDRLYAVGGDGLQLFEGYESEAPLIHRGRLGAPFHTGGDHTAHTILRGVDGRIYFVTGDGGGVEGRKHITEKSSPALRERAGSVFRLSPDGRRWECVATGGRNAPSLGMNYLAELFSWDSDMEWHVDLPFYRPLRLNHWVRGSDQGWQGVGAYPPYYIDTLPPILSTGRGSPNWGVFYEHHMLPERFHDAFLVCDYLWKSATSGQYNTSGRLVVFDLSPAGSGWKSGWETLARPKPGARDDRGRAINFALVDIEVAPDGSLYLSDHNQGIWRILYAPAGKVEPGPPMVAWPPLSPDPERLVDQAMHLPQKGSEWSRLRLEEIRRETGLTFEERLRARALDPRVPRRTRLAALRLLAPDFEDLSEDFLGELGGDAEPLVRGQAAWLSGLKARGATPALVLKLARDADPWVRRKAAEAMTRTWDEESTPSLLEIMRDEDRLVRYVAMMALAHRPAETWWPLALDQPHPQTVLRALVAARLREESPPMSFVSGALLPLVRRPDLATEDHLDLLRVLGLYQEPIRDHSMLGQAVAERLVRHFPGQDERIRWEQIRLAGQFRPPALFAPLLTALEEETDPITQFHLARALSRFESGWTPAEAERLFEWFAGTQEGWFAEFTGKGRQFPDFWGTVLADYTRHHPDRIAGAESSKILPESQLGRLVVEARLERVDSARELLEMYENQPALAVRQRILRRMGEFPDPLLSRRLAEICRVPPHPRLKTAALISLSRMPYEASHEPILLEGLNHREVDVALACAEGLSQRPPTNPRPAAEALLRQMGRHPDAARWISPALAGLTEDSRHPGWITRRPRESEERMDPDRYLGYWTDWYEERFHRPFRPEQAAAGAFATAEALFDFLASDRIRGGDPDRGRELFEKAQCLQCHGGEGLGGGRLFGPDLAGVMGRLNRNEFAESIAYPSRQVAERYRATEVELKDGTVWTGFITQQTPEVMTLATQETIKQIPKKEIDLVQAQTLSLMPEGLLAGMSRGEIRDLIAYIGALGN